ncbi:Pyruvate carboxylase subunit A [Scedosporium apiospermum]|uniref:Pyruvate carboxylase subunit A n=1 Tax=Pseudallescheria apiosperma TaxID=563466 RepID=A0A084G6X7_PSEDA|nr:Pyruvate carboxylase subunit A [Scedosporium apiospermum]KEZ43089.1 Pyruvate carboxylase subunit A [Scedosporium apiospermum]
MGKQLFVPDLPKGSNPIRRVFIANRGEIALRVIRTCRTLGLTSIAVFTNEDALSRHVSEADETTCLGSASQENGSPFLNIPLLIDAAKTANADAIHPGYGYLSENADFAAAVRDAGIVFIGPTSQAILTLGDKRQSKEYLSQHSDTVPLIPGFTGRSQDLAELERAADTIGYPVMLKASAGGGGKGIRIIRERAALKAELERAQSEAARSFGSSDCILEKYIEAGKHVEVQIIGDRHGQIISLFERECSVQRRHQKIIEESPCPWLTPVMRRSMCDVACEIGRLIAYEGAGTVEFIVDVQAAKFYFLEVNSRIQVEHPITEEVTGVDIVALQLYVASNGNLNDLPLSDLSQNGHAIECRLYAENPQRGFLPELGTIHLWKQAGDEVVTSDEVRYETAVVSGTEINMSFDPLIAKIVVWAASGREAAIRKMVAVLANTAYATNFVGSHLDELLKHPYGSGIQDVVNSLAAIPGAYLKMKSAELARNDPHRGFQRNPVRFRNQRGDKANKYTQVTVARTQRGIATDITIDSPVLSVWDQHWVRSSLDENMYLLSVAPILDHAQASLAYDSSAARRLTAVYANLSDLVKEAGRGTASSIHVKILSVSRLNEKDLQRATAEAATIAIDVDNVRISGTLVLPNGNDYRGAGNDIARGTKVFMHVPALGTWFSFEVFTLLAYVESLKATFATAEDSAEKDVVTAPMPCKILRVLKKSGDAVKAEGQAVKEGDTLCSVE